MFVYPYDKLHAIDLYLKTVYKYKSWKDDTNEKIENA
jgi:hypothetical protein